MFNWDKILKKLFNDHVHFSKIKFEIENTFQLIKQAFVFVTFAKKGYFEEFAIETLKDHIRKIKS